jgi:hypothetical protein
MISSAALLCYCAEIAITCVYCDIAEARQRFAIIPALGGSMAPDFTTPLTVYLASDACQSTHSIYSSLGGRFARVFIGVTEGWQGSRDQPSTAEDIAAHIDEIRDTKRGFGIPADLLSEYESLLSRQPQAAS